MPEGYDDGGEVDQDHEDLMDQCAMEVMEAIESKDKAKFREAFEVLISDIMDKMSFEEGED